MGSRRPQYFNTNLQHFPVYYHESITSNCHWQLVCMFFASQWTMPKIQLWPKTMLRPSKHFGVLVFFCPKLRKTPVPPSFVRLWIFSREKGRRIDSNTCHRIEFSQKEKPRATFFFLFLHLFAQVMGLFNRKRSTDR